MKSIVRTLTVVTAGALLTVALSAQAVDVTGEWTFNVQTDQGGGTNWITKTTQFSTLRYGLLGEVSYKF